MKKYPIFNLLLAGMAICSLSCIPAYAENTVTIKNTFETTDPDDTGKDTFKDTYQDKGITYHLTDVDSEIIKTEEIEPDIITKEMDGSFDESAMIEPPETIEQDGVTYQLQKKEKKEKQLDSTTKYVERVIPFTNLEDENAVPAKAEIVESDNPGNEVVQYMPLLDVTVQKEGWNDTFEFPITVKDYDADVFLLGDVEIPRTASFLDYSDAFLDYLGLQKDKYRITSIEWTGEEYESDGVVYRNAIAKGDKYVVDVEARYGGDMVLGGGTVYYYECEYINPEQTGSTVYTVTATGTYTAEEPETEPEPTTEPPEETEAETEAEVPEPPRRNIVSRVIGWITENPIASLGIGTLAVVGVGLLILFIFARKKKGKKGEEYEVVEFDDDGEADEEDESDE